MKTGFFRKKETTGKKALFRGNKGVLMICVGIAFLFWLLNTLSERYIYTISLPVKYINAPEDKLIAEPLPNELDLRVEATGQNLLLKILGFNKPALTVDLQRFQNRGYLTTRSRISFFENQLSPGFNVLSVSPDTIYFKFDEKATKKVPITISTDLTFARQHNLAGDIKIKPDSVTISGPALEVNKISSWPAKKVKLREMKKSYRASIPLQKPDNPTVKLSAKTVAIDIPVEKFTEGSIEVPVEILNSPSDAQVIIFPKRVKITYHVALNNYKKVNPDDFKAVADFAKVESREEQSIPVQLTKFPKLITNVNIDPQTVEYVLYK